jgi:hypothetical protein
MYSMCRLLRYDVGRVNKALIRRVADMASRVWADEAAAGKPDPRQQLLDTILNEQNAGQPSAGEGALGNTPENQSILEILEQNGKLSEKQEDQLTSALKVVYAFGTAPTSTTKTKTPEAPPEQQQASNQAASQLRRAELPYPEKYYTDDAGEVKNAGVLRVQLHKQEAATPGDPNTTGKNDYYAYYLPTRYVNPDQPSMSWYDKFFPEEVLTEYADRVQTVSGMRTTQQPNATPTMEKGERV